jgi:hypothetical protein
MKVYLATPMYGGQCTAGYTSSVINLLKRVPAQHMFITNESLITRARNMLAHLFLASDCDRLLFVDADVAFDAEDVVRMLASDKDVIGGLYAKKAIDWGRVHAAALQGVPAQHLSEFASDYVVRGDVPRAHDGPVEVEAIGTGLLMIHRRVFEAMRPHAQTKPLGSSLLGQLGPADDVTFYFETGFSSTTKEFLSEDYMFCQTWRELGGKVYAAPWVRTLHIGTHTFG